MCRKYETSVSSDLDGTRDRNSRSLGSVASKQVSLSIHFGEISASVERKHAAVEGASHSPQRAGKCSTGMQLEGEKSVERRILGAYP